MLEFVRNKNLTNLEPIENMDRKEIANILGKEQVTLIGVVILIVIGIYIVTGAGIGITLVGKSIEGNTIVQAIVAALTVIFSVWKISATVKQSNKNTFINTITIARKEYMITLRKTVTEFCIAAENKDNKKLKELSYQLKMLMFPARDTDEMWDREAIKMIDTIVEATNKKKYVDEFVTLMQSWLALEWSGMREECKHGIMSEEQVKELQKEYYQQYKNFIAQKNNEQKQHNAILIIVQ